MNKMILENLGKIDWDFAEKIAERLSPENLPGFWNDREVNFIFVKLDVKKIF
jgi:hypothetical protein